MFVKRLVLENFRSFRGKHEFEFVPGLNCIVGDNNCGKSTLYEAITYLMGVGKAGENQICSEADGIMRVEMDIAGDDLMTVLSSDKYKKLKDYAFAVDGCPALRIERSPETREITQSGKPKTIDGRAIPVWNQQSDPPQFENPTGIDALIKRLIDFEPVWADTIPGDVADFGSTKILGKIIDAQVKGFSDTAVWKEFIAAHAKAFSDDAGSLARLMDEMAQEIATIVNSQYGQAAVRFGFDPPDASTLVKGGKLYVDDGAGETHLAIKGTGMQRAFALALIQVLAKVSGAGVDSGTPLVLLIDEPETWLHPRAQLQLGEALVSVATTQQLFLITHSPYLLRHFDPDAHQLVVFRDKGQPPERQTTLGVTVTGKPSWGEINYRAFGMSSDEFLDELYTLTEGHSQTWGAAQAPPVNGKSVRKFLEAQGLPTSRTWQYEDTRGMQNVPLAVFVRQSIHHPGTGNTGHTQDDLKQAIDDLLGVLDKLSPLPEPANADAEVTGV
jgi:predicted ATPase